jgi:hypothetical protein
MEVIWKVPFYNLEQSLTPSNGKITFNLLRFEFPLSRIVFGGFYLRGLYGGENMKNTISQRKSSQVTKNLIHLLLYI